ncbi:ATP-binding protein [Candidatus Methylospira mobilis]|uniref:sensor histidine kinase n=1 Tax=Candidatus Methylospira mobilis TaxID=1808979 RepID=UPI0028EE2346|nr:ATP-binding protein [Candidatus Methylospira mobilis]WNV04849.1 ATP-binding protein [Candidatus Methylospira mobilis]
MRWELQETNTRYTWQIAENQHRLADFTMAYDFIGRLMPYQGEQCIIGDILELFTVLCAPRAVHLLLTGDNDAWQYFSHPAGSGNSDMLLRLLQRPEPHGVLDTIQGFYFHIIYGEQTMGLVAVEEILNAERQRAYLNLALLLMPVLRVAIANARTYDRLCDTERALRASQAELEQRVEERTAELTMEITERKQTEEALRESALYARSLIEASLDPLVTIGADGRIMDVNASTENATGVTRGRLIGSDFSDYFTEPEKARAGYRQVFEQGSVTDYPLAIRHASGKLTDVLYNATLYRDIQGNVAGIFAAARDITTRKKVEEELKRSNAELDQFAYAVSHDMRQPLRMVTSYMSLIEKALDEQLDEDTRQYMIFAIDGATRMDRMILAMLDYSRIGRKTDPITPVSSREVLDEALTMLKPGITSGAATVEVTGDWPELVASRDELMRLLQNLIGNALKYHEPDQPPRVEVHAAATPTLFRVTIRDHGIGIDPNQSERLFKVFSRLQARTRFEGAGIGLALCRKIVEHQGGRIGVESAGEGCGSTFWFELPRKSAAEKS